MFKYASCTTPALSSCILSKPLTSKIFYEELVLLTQQNGCHFRLPSKRLEYSSNTFSVSIFVSFPLPFKATKKQQQQQKKKKQEKLINMFRYKIVHHILFTNTLLYKLKKVSSPHCPSCPAIHQTIAHLYVDCKQAQPFGLNFKTGFCNYATFSSLFPP